MDSVTHSETLENIGTPLSLPRETPGSNPVSRWFAGREALVVILLLALGFGLRAWKISGTERVLKPGGCFIVHETNSAESSFSVLYGICLPSS